MANWRFVLALAGAAVTGTGLAWITWSARPAGYLLITIGIIGMIPHATQMWKEERNRKP